jgi:hypothetical protein
MTEPIIEEMEAFLRDWAARNKVIYENEGECGFGRECVGITDGNAWIDLGPPTNETISGRHYSFPSVLDEAWPPEGVTDAYHKHNCLAVLGRGQTAVHQLYLWVNSLEANGVVVTHTARMPTHEIDLLLHGTSTPHLILRANA